MPDTFPRRFSGFLKDHNILMDFIHTENIGKTKWPQVVIISAPVPDNDIVRQKPTVSMRRQRSICRG